MGISFVVITRDRWPVLVGVLDRLRSAYPDVRVVVVDNGSRVAAPPLGDGVELLRCREDVGAYSRNVGVQHAGTEFVAFCDDDAWWAPGSLEQAVTRMRDAPRLAGIVGRVLVEPEGRLDPVSEEHERSGRVTGFMATALIARAAAFLEAGGYHRRFRIGGEEELLAMRLFSAGWDLAYEPGAVLHHAPVGRAHATRSGQPLARARNRLWTAWLRRPLPEAARETGRVLREVPHPKVVATAAAGLPWVLRERDVNPPDVERLYR